MNPEQYSLGDLIAELQSHDRAKVVRLGISEPHSYRGYYDEQAFETVADSTVGAMLDAANSALGVTYHGYKGGDYTMDKGTPVWLASYGCTGETLGKAMLSLMLGHAEQVNAER